jgi:hypothetical protein
MFLVIWQGMRYGVGIQEVREWGFHILDAPILPAPNVPRRQFAQVGSTLANRCSNFY